MGATLSLTITESSVNQAANTSVVKAVLKVKSTSGSWNGNSPYGYITIDGTKYTFNHSFSANTTTTLATKSKTVTHNVDGSKSVTVKGYYQTGVSPGNISTSKTFTCTKIARQFTVSFNANGGSGAPGAQTKTYGTALQLSSTVPTRGGYIFKGWATSSTGDVSYSPGGYYYSESAITLYAVWEAVNYTITFNANGGSGGPTSVIKPHDTTIALPTTAPTRNHYKFIGWSTTTSGTVQYVAGASYTGNANATLYAVWEYVYAPPTIRIVDAYRTNSSSGTAEVPSGTYIYLKLEWSSDVDWSPPTISVKCNNVALTGPTISGNHGTAVFRGSNLSKNTTGNIVATITDKSSQELKTTTATAVIGKSIVPFRLKPDAAEFGAGAWFGGDVRFGGDGFHDSNSVSLLDIIYPIGTIYETSKSQSDFDPNVIWGGTWSLVQGRVLVGAGTSDVTYELGATGGESNHTLALSEIPSHGHSVSASLPSKTNMSSGTWSAETVGAISGSGFKMAQIKDSQTFSYSASVSVSQSNAGGGGAHNNMPPYKVVNIWERTA